MSAGGDTLGEVRFAAWSAVATRLTSVRTGSTPSSQERPRMSGSLALVSIITAVPLPG